MDLYERITGSPLDLNMSMEELQKQASQWTIETSVWLSVGVDVRSEKWEVVGFLIFLRKVNTAM
jgi:hypothetical protein